MYEDGMTDSSKEGYDYMEGESKIVLAEMANEMYGQEGNDSIYGGNDNDYIDGGTGT